MRLWNTKGVLDHPGDVFLLILGSVFVLVFLYIALQGSVREQQGSSLLIHQELEAQQAILSYLRTPLKGATTAAELITLGERDEQQRQELETLTLTYLRARDSPFLKGITVRYPNNSTLLMFSDASLVRPALLVQAEDSVRIGSFRIPFRGGEQIVVTLYRAKNTQEIFQRGFTMPGGKV